MAMDEKDALFEQNLALLKAKYRTGDIPKISRMERQILEFCHGRDMVEFVREEFRNNPILYDENGNAIENPKYATDVPTDTFFARKDTGRAVIDFTGDDEHKIVIKD